MGNSWSSTTRGGVRTRRTRHWHCRRGQLALYNHPGVRIDDVHDRVARIVATGGAGANTRLLAEDVAELPLALIP